MNGQSTTGQKAIREHASTREKAVHDELARGFGDISQCELDETAIKALDRILELGENDIFYCEATCLSYAAHVLMLENCPRELWIISDLDVECADPMGDYEQQYVEDMVEKGRAVARVVSERHPRFKGFASEPSAGPYKVLISAEYGVGYPDPPSWPEMGSYFYLQLDVNTSRAAIIYPSLDNRSVAESFSEGVLAEEWLSWAVQLPSSRMVLGVGGGNGCCRMVDLSDPERPWEIEASPFTVAACGGCLVPSLCRKCVEAIEEATLGELAIRISRGTSLSRKALNPYECKTDESGERYGNEAREGDLLYLDSSCINSDVFEPLYIDEIPRGQERYTVLPHDGEVLLVSRNEKRFVFYEAICPTLIANSVYIAWLGSRVDNRYLECWLEGSFARKWLKTAGEMSFDYRDSEPILSKGTLSTLPVPILDEEIARQTVARKSAILQRIQELYYEIGTLESKEAFAPASAMAELIEETDER